MPDSAPQTAMNPHSPYSALVSSSTGSAIAAAIAPIAMNIWLIRELAGSTVPIFIFIALFVIGTAVGSALGIAGERKLASVARVGTPLAGALVGVATLATLAVILEPFTSISIRVYMVVLASIPLGIGGGILVGSSLENARANQHLARHAARRGVIIGAGITPPLIILQFIAKEQFGLHVGYWLLSEGWLIFAGAVAATRLALPANDN